jgi:hypothetical protein
MVLNHTTVVGRQGLFAPPALLRQLFVRYGLPISEESEAFFGEERAEWADSFFRALGAGPLEFLDASPYEGATRIHDLNRPIGKDWEESADTLIDSGSLEHVFDVKMAVENYLRLVRVGGSILLLDMPAVNLCGHGFYQFSPEFFCEVFSKANGFELETLALAAEWGYSTFYTVAHPRDAGGRVEIPSPDACHLFVRARKIREFRGFGKAITQSDYAAAWNHPRAVLEAPPPRHGISEALRRAWRRIDPVGYWRFSTRRDRRRSVRANAIGRGRYVVPLDI